MKKSLVWAAVIIVVVLIGVGLAFAYSASKEKGSASEKLTNESVAQLFSEKLGQPITAGTADVIRITADTGLFAKGTYNEANGGGGIWFAAKTANGWELASAGNGIVPCEDINKYNFPKDMIPQCLDTQNGNELITR